MEKLKDVINLLNQGKVREEAEKNFCKVCQRRFSKFFSFIFYFVVISSKVKRDFQKAFEFANKNISLNPKVCRWI